MRHSIEWPVSDDVVLRDRQRLAGGDPDLLLDQVELGDHLADRVLDLDAGVHLHEAEVAVVVEQELHRAGARVADRQRAVDGPLADVRAAAPASRWIEGASSISFWWRRWTEQSRSQK